MYNLIDDKQLKKIKIKRYQSGQIIFKENDICNHVGLVKSGQVIIKSFSESGKEIVYNIRNAGEMFGNNLIFSEDKHYLGDVIAIKDSAIFLFDEKQLLSILNNNTLFLKAYLLNQANSIKKLNAMIKMFSFNNARERLIYYFKINHNQIAYDSITLLANELLLQRETLSRLINKMIKEGKIIKQEKTLIYQK